MVKSRRFERAIARTIAIGLRLEPQTPIPIVIPSRNISTASSIVARLSVLTGGSCSLVERRRALLDERGARLVGCAGHVQLVGKALLVSVRALDVDRVDPVQRFLRAPDDRRRLLDDPFGERERLLAKLGPRDD